MSLSNNLSKILIIDFGSQFTQLIARRVRELGVFSEIVSHKKIKIAQITKDNIAGIILSGGPLNVYENDKFKFDKKILKLGIPILGICFGHQILSKLLGGKVKKSKHREFGLATCWRRSFIRRTVVTATSCNHRYCCHSDRHRCPATGNF